MGTCFGRLPRDTDYLVPPTLCRLCRTQGRAEMTTVIFCKCGRAVVVHARCRRTAATRNECWCGD